MGNRFHSRTTEEDKVEIKRLYESGILTKDIAITFGVSDRWIRIVLSDKGVKIKDQHKGIRLPSRVSPPEETIEYSSLPDTILFNPKNFPSI